MSNLSFRNFNPEAYSKLIEYNAPYELSEFMNSEITLINKLLKNKKYNIYDLGAGHGRLISTLSANFDSYTGIEINPSMYSELKKRCVKYENAKAINGDLSFLDEIVNNKPNSLFILAQNTIGTLEGSLKDILKQISKVIKSTDGKLIISFFNSKAMKDFGRKILFPHIESMIGELDIYRSNLNSGRLVTTSGYTSKWWNNKEQKEIIDLLGLSIKKRIFNHIYTIYLLEQHEHN